MTVTQAIAPDKWRATIERAVADGDRFAAAWASRDDAQLCWRALLLGANNEQRVVSCDAPDRRVDSVVDVVAAANWDEREAHDIYGLDFRGHEPMRALVAHPQDDTWMTRVSGDGVHQVAVGPIHAGVIESGHFRFHVIGERILAMDPRLFYKHRGLERAAEDHECAAGLSYAQRACGACAVTNSLAYTQAIEDATGLHPDRDLRRARTVLLELERLYNHLHDIAAICAGVGFAPGAMAFAALKDRAQQINAAGFGHRFLFGTIALGHGAVELNATQTDTMRSALRELHTDAAAAWRELEFTASLQARLDAVGVLTREDALRLGAVGPAARASGLREDLRSASPQLAYDGFVAAALTVSKGDVAARLRIRALELETTLDLLDDLLAQTLHGGTTSGGGPKSALGVGRVEGSRGATTCVSELAGSRIARLHLRTGSYANWPALAHAAAGNLLPDFPLINKSFELCYACVDR